METKLKLLLTKILYEKLELKKYEEKLVFSNIEPKTIVNEDNLPVVSKYFFLLNEINFKKLSQEDYTYLNNVILRLENLQKDELDVLYKFLNSKLYDLLLLETDLKYLYWGGTSFEYMAPADAIVFGLHYKVDIQEDEKNISLKQSIVTDIANNIQEEAIENKKIKVSVILYDNLKLTNARQL